MAGPPDVLVDMLLEKQEELVTYVREAVQAELPAYRDLLRDRYDSDLGLEIRQVLQCARSGQQPYNEELLETLSGVGKVRAQQGIPLADILRSWRVATQAGIAYARDVGRYLGTGDNGVLDLVESVLPWVDVAMATTAEAYRKARLSVACTEEDRRAAFARAVLLGTVSPAELRIDAEAYGIDPVGEYVAFRASMPRHHGSRRFVEALGLGDPSQRFCALVDGDVAGFASGAPRHDVVGLVGYGPPRPLDRLVDSYRLAGRALMTARACGLRGAYAFSSLSVRSAVAADVDVGDVLRKRYLQPLEQSGSAGDLMATLRAYLACGTHVERTAMRLHVHQNTVRYRLARFEELTGASLHDTETLVEAWWAVELSTMIL